MQSKTVIINNRLGLHARPSACIVKATAKFESEIFLVKDGRKINGKSIMGVMMLAAAPGQEVTVITDGPDEQEAVQVIAELVGSKFDFDH